MSLQQLAGVLRKLNLRDAYKCYHLTLKGCQRVPCASFQTSAARDGKQKFIDMGIDLSKYSLRPLPLPKTGGRGPDGKIQTHGIGGGHKQRYRRVDFVRKGPKEGEPHIERITKIRYDPCRSADIAIAVSGNHKRYILATENMKVGDLIETYGNIPRIAVRPKEGNAYPLGALPISTLVHNIEKFAGEGGEYARAAGTCGELVRKVGDRCIVKLPSKREINVHQECMATVGRVSNIDHNKQKIGSAGRARWFGIRPQSGWWHRKTGYNGRKIRPVPPMITYTKPQAPSPEVRPFTLKHLSSM